MALATTVVAALSLYNASPAACNDRVHAIGCETHRLTDLVCAQLTIGLNRYFLLGTLVIQVSPTTPVS